MELKICHLYPDVLNLYGDRGNIAALSCRLRWRGMDVRVRELKIGDTAHFSEYDLVFIGGGQDFEQEVLLDDLHTGKDRALKSAIEDGMPVLAICGGYQMLGAYYETHEGVRCDFIGALDLYTVGSHTRMIGNYMFDCGTQTPAGTVVAFENHSGKTWLGAGVEPLGTVRAGFGNNGEDGTEGVRYKNVFGTYGHGPLLPKNPKLCDTILQSALVRKYGACELAPLDDTAENAAHEEMCARLRR